jgi:GntR family transcriptional repressor for pyruvate dehydrogenase complex
MRSILRLAPIGGVADLMRCFEFRIGLRVRQHHWQRKEEQKNRRAEEQLAVIQEVFEELNRVNATGQVGAEEDIRFHAAIAAASRNQLFIQTLDALAIHVFNGMKITRSLPLRAAKSGSHWCRTNTVAWRRPSETRT